VTCLRSKFFVLGRQTLAVTTPRCIELNENVFGRIIHDLIECRRYDDLNSSNRKSLYTITNTFLLTVNTSFLTVCVSAICMSVLLKNQDAENRNWRTNVSRGKQKCHFSTQIDGVMVALF